MSTETKAVPDEPAKPELEPTKIFKCRDAACRAWVREEFATEQQVCPICGGPMLRSIRHLPAIPGVKKKRKAPVKRK
ncbi:hypothetical protein IDH44_03050 [Paenibacillus sp. IB182496]|uniref:Cold-inducible protein YdjO n=1 Tax=Paenibacillus sabuli TaxID=2772509 RepID=A0A927BP55_9BACL|nr:cold-inducible protein YdjO-related protein [Paenibacillus sabuli]MBD2844153.1 hypothetical protein [Paenibacillus sabuli]